MAYPFVALLAYIPYIPTGLGEAFQALVLSRLEYGRDRQDPEPGHVESLECLSSVQVAENKLVTIDRLREMPLHRQLAIPYASDLAQKPDLRFHQTAGFFLLELLGLEVVERAGIYFVKVILIFLVKVKHRSVRGIELAADILRLTVDDIFYFVGAYARGIYARVNETFRIYAASACPARHLVKVARLEVADSVAVEFPELVKYHRAARHIDAERECLGRKYDLKEPRGEQPFDDLFQGREHARVMESDATFDERDHRDRTLLMREVEFLAEALIHSPDLILFMFCQEREVVELSRQILSPLTAEDKVDTGQPILVANIFYKSVRGVRTVTTHTP